LTAWFETRGAAALLATRTLILTLRSALARVSMDEAAYLKMSLSEELG
jgi:hypothetical protein